MIPDMKNQSTIEMSQLSPSQKEEIVQLMMMSLLPVTLMALRLLILAVHG